MHAALDAPPALPASDETPPHRVALRIDADLSFPTPITPNWDNFRITSVLSRLLENALAAAHLRPDGALVGPLGRARGTWYVVHQRRAISVILRELSAINLLEQARVGLILEAEATVLQIHPSSAVIPLNKFIPPGDYDVFRRHIELCSETAAHLQKLYGEKIAADLANPSAPAADETRNPS